ncbi:MAG: ribosome-associated protein [Phycisphaerales bacterium]|jgi:ribosome-associated protein
MTTPPDQPDPPGQPGQPEDGVRLAPGVTLPDDAVRFEYSRASGPGGQNVNKRATKARLRVMLADLPIDAGARRRLAAKHKANLTEDRELLIESDEHRSQRRNREACLDRLGAMVRAAMVKPKPRRKTKPSRGAIERRIQEKKQRGDRKQQRRKKDW